MATKTPILSGTQNMSQQPFWSISLPQKSPNIHQSNAYIGNPTIADRVAFFHGAMFSPTLPTWCNTIDAGLLVTWPKLTSAQVRKYPPNAQSTIKGHLNDQQSNLHYTTKQYCSLSITATPTPSATHIIPLDDDPSRSDVPPLTYQDVVLAEPTEKPPTTSVPPSSLQPIFLTQTHNVYCSIQEVIGKEFSD